VWKIYKYNGHYIQGDLLSKHLSEDAALKQAAKKIGFTFVEKVKRGKETIIWLDDEFHNPLGLITKKSRG
jgi:hypothetical protein